MKLTALGIVAAITLLGGCMYTLPKVSEMTPQQYKDSHTHVSRDDFEKTTTIATTANFFRKEDTDPHEAYYLIATKKDGGKVSYWLGLYSKYSVRDTGRAFWEWAADENGNKFPLETDEAYFQADRTFIIEQSSAQVSKEYLESVRKTGITWRFYGRFTITTLINSQAIDGFLMKVDEVFKN